MSRGLLVAAALLALAGCGQSNAFLSPPSTVGPAVSPAEPFGQVVGGQYVVAPGDTVAVVSERTNTPIRTLIDLNRLSPPYALQAGQRLTLQPRNDYIVQRGDTVSGIAARQGVSVSALIQLNNLRPPYTLQIGQSLVLPTGADAPLAAAASPQPVAATPSTPQPKPFVPSAPQPTAQPQAIGQPQPIGQAEPIGASTQSAPKDVGGGVTATSLPPLQPAPVSTPPAAAPQSAAVEPAPQPQPLSQPAAQPDPAPSTPAAKGDPLPTVKAGSAFIWPVDGKVVAKFGPTKDNQRNDGINIAAPAGAPVLASAAGTVAYAGNELRGFGNMVLLRHADGWVTAYAHNSALLVKKGDKVKQGQIIARVGSSGSVDSPQLHFELRQGTKAVDPLKNLTR
jgi:murein DD-endopeptidase MepM/ murein hydrolase activator NlpD